MDKKINTELLENIKILFEEEDQIDIDFIESVISQIKNSAEKAHNFFSDFARFLEKTKFFDNVFYYKDVKDLNGNRILIENKDQTKKIHFEKFIFELTFASYKIGFNENIENSKTFYFYELCDLADKDKLDNFFDYVTKNLDDYMQKIQFIHSNNFPENETKELSNKINKYLSEF